MLSINYVRQRKASKHIISIEGNGDDNDETDADKKSNEYPKTYNYHLTPSFSRIFHEWCQLCRENEQMSGRTDMKIFIFARTKI